MMYAEAAETILTFLSLPFLVLWVVFTIWEYRTETVSTATDFFFTVGIVFTMCAEIVALVS